MRIFSLAADTSKTLDYFIQLLKPSLFRLTKLDHRTYYPPCLMFELTSLIPVSHKVTPVVTCDTCTAKSEAPLDQFKFTRTQQEFAYFAPKSSYISPNRRYFKGGLVICCVVHIKRASKQVGEQ